VTDVAVTTPLPDRVLRGPNDAPVGVRLHPHELVRFDRRGEQAPPVRTDRRAVEGGQAVSRYFASLPQWLRRDPRLGQVLLAFERILDGARDLPEGTPEPTTPGLSELVDRLAACFRPGPGEPDRGPRPVRVRALAGPLGRRRPARRVGRRDPPPRRRRGHAAVPPARHQGGPAPHDRRLRRPARLGPDPRVRRVPHFFQVEVTLPTRDPKALARTDRSVRAIIDQEKPAHTFYGLRFAFPSMQIVDNPTKSRPAMIVGVNTLLGSKFV
jgi:hypothetical protein